jgi:hypothetical protein
MAVGSFNIHEYLNKLNEEAEQTTEDLKTEDSKEISDKINQDGGVSGDSGIGIIIPDENKRAYDWIKREYDKAKVEVKVEIKQTGAKFEPGMTNLSATNNDNSDFKPGLFGNTDGTTKAPEGMSKGTEKTPTNPQAKESDEQSPADVKSKSNISVKAKTVEDGSEKEIKEASTKKKEKTSSKLKSKKRLKFKKSAPKDKINDKE